MEVETAGSKPYPGFLKVENLKMLLVGTGIMGFEKINTLLFNSPEAENNVVKIFIKDEVRSLLQKHPSCNIVQRTFEVTDLRN